MEHEIEMTVEVGGDEVRVCATVDVDGEYHPATWGYDGGSPEEWPEACVVRVVRSDTGVEIPVESLSEKAVEAIESRAIETHMERDGDGYDPLDDE
jgi:hypothetical protein